MTAYVTSIERIGIQKGWQKGWEEGREEGRFLALLAVQLQRRFGVLPTEYEQQLFKACKEELLLWRKRLTEAETLEDVFQPISIED